MQLWHRRLPSVQFSCLFLVVGFQLASASVLKGQEPSIADEKPNALRSPMRVESRSEEPPIIEWQDSANIPTEEDNESEDWLIIGSAGTRLAGGDDSEEPEFLEFAEIEKDAESDDNNLALAFELANASFSHSMSVFSWLIQPSLIPYQSPAKQSPTNKENSDPSRVNLEGDGIAINPEQPELLAQTPAQELPLDENTASKELTDKESASKDLNQAEAVSKKPAPRAIRTPFETQDAKKVSAKTTPVPQHDPDSDAEQDEPRLSTADIANDRDSQGVDAIKASKPGAHRREIRIPDPSSEGQSVPPTQGLSNESVPPTNKKLVPPTDNMSKPPIVKKRTFEPELEHRLQKAHDCLRYYLENPESTSSRSPWAVMHALLAFGGEYELIHGQSRVNAIGWMCHNGTCRTQRMFTPKGRSFVPNVGGGVQGHEGQFLAILAQSNVPLDYPIQIGTSHFKVEDLVRFEMATCKEKSELTFKLIGLSYYLDSNKQWKANDGKIWSIPKLIQEELAQPVIGSACGGTHRLMGFSFCVRQRQLQNQPINGQYSRAAKFVREYVAYTLQLQNPDGSFSSDWYEGRANDPNEERKVQTSGHMLEWLMFTMTDEEIGQPKIVKGVDFLLSKIYDKRERKWPIGPRGHATRAIALYESRISELKSSAIIPSTVSRPNTSAAKGTSAAPIIRK